MSFNVTIIFSFFSFWKCCINAPKTHSKREYYLKIKGYLLWFVFRIYSRNTFLCKINNFSNFSLFFLFNSCVSHHSIYVAISSNISSFSFFLTLQKISIIPTYPIFVQNLKVCLSNLFDILQGLYYRWSENESLKTHCPNESLEYSLEIA